MMMPWVVALCGVLLLAGALPAAAAPKQAANLAFERGTVNARPIAVMIDNHPGAYPQAGMDQAAIVFETLAEFGITRFMAIYLPGVTPQPASIGPVRSARAYYVRWAMGFRALYAHAGGSPEALEMLGQTDLVTDVDALKRANGGYFTRSSSRRAPHNLFTTGAKLEQAAADKGVAAFGDSELGFLMKDGAPAEQRGAAQTLTYFFLYKQDPAGWTYEPETNTYLRLRRGKPAIDALTRQQLRTSNVVVMEVPERPIPGDAKGRIEQDVIGSGPARLFQDGQVYEITWSKPSAADQLRFLGSDGSEVRMNRGQVWIAALPSLKNLTVN
jgi:hypothetical protein